MSRDRAHVRPFAGPVAVGVVLAATVTVIVSTGCQKSLFSSKGTRTQFENYERVRQRSVNPVEPDVFGNPRPALRARLSRQ